jgi:hypothetical protein
METQTKSFNDQKSPVIFRLTINHSAPIPVLDSAQLLMALNSLYFLSINEKIKVKKVITKKMLYISQVKEGSIIVDMLPFLPDMDIMEYLNNPEFIDFLNTAIKNFSLDNISNLISSKIENIKHLFNDEVNMSNIIKWTIRVVKFISWITKEIQLYKSKPYKQKPVFEQIKKLLQFVEKNPNATIVISLIINGESKANVHIS